MGCIAPSSKLENLSLPSASSFFYLSILLFIAIIVEQSAAAVPSNVLPRGSILPGCDRLHLEIGGFHVRHDDRHEIIEAHPCNTCPCINLLLRHIHWQLSNLPSCCAAGPPPCAIGALSTAQASSCVCCQPELLESAGSCTCMEQQQDQQQRQRRQQQRQQ